METQFDPMTPADFWRVLGCRATGAAVVTTAGADGPAGFLALSVTHLCATPPTMLVTVGRTTSALGTLLASGSFAVNYLAADGQAIADTFSGRTGAKGAQRFDGIDWKAGSHGAPLLGAAFGILECSVVETIERYETAIVIGALHRATHRPGAPLVYLGGKALAPAH